MMEHEIVIICSRTIFCMKAGSAISRPTTWREAAGGSARVTSRVTLGRTSIDMKRTSAAEENSPIWAACRRMRGRSAMVLNHSCAGGKKVDKGGRGRERQGSAGLLCTLVQEGHGSKKPAAAAHMCDPAHGRQSPPPTHL